MHALASADDKEILHCLKTLKNTHAGAGFVHELFHVDNPGDFSMKWFAWANTIFGELTVKLYENKAELLKW